MTIKNTKNKKQTKLQATPQQRAAQIIFAILALILILSMVLSATTTY